MIQPHDITNPPPTVDLSRWCLKRLSSYKCPKSWEFIAELHRTDTSKMRRSALVDERVADGANVV